MSMSAEQIVQRSGSPLENSLLALARLRIDACAAGAARSVGVHEKRRSALRWLESHGLPNSRQESFRNSRIADLLRCSLGETPASLEPSASGDSNSRETPSTRPELYIIDGVARSDATQLAGIRWLPMAEAIASETVVQEHFGTLACIEDGFVAANQAGFSDGWCLIVDPGIELESTIELCVVTSDTRRAMACLSRVLLFVGAGSHVRLVERHSSGSGEPSLTSLVTEIVLEPKATLEHSRWVECGEQAWSFATTAVSVADDARYCAWSVSSRGRFVRHDLLVRLVGRRAKADLDGLYYGRTGEMVDQRVRVWHEQPEGVTKECYRGIVENRGRGSFDGIMYVGRGAIQTDARQENRNLLLGPEAIAHTKPHLEIDADDVACSHGATVGQLDEQQLFYLRSRGIDAAMARDVLTWAFAKDIVDRCPDSRLRTLVEESLHAVDSWVPTAAIRGS